MSHQRPRQRASCACVFCHSRKVKCDALKKYPCTRCKESNLQCTLRTSHRGRTRRLELKGASRSARAAGFRLFEMRAEAANPHETLIPSPASSDDLIRSLENFIDNSNDVVDDGHSVGVIHATDHNAFTAILNVTTDTEENSRRNVHLYVGFPGQSSTTERCKEAIGLLDPETRAFLAAKGAFDWPDQGLADHLVHVYFKYSDPQLPILHKRDFLERYAARDVSPLLFHSVMFVASQYASEDHVAASPWTTRVDMTSSFFEKAKLIADFELEKDQFTLVQSFVLLSERWSSWMEDRNTRYWMSRAINVAYVMGLHRRIETLNLTLAQRRLWSRVSWIIMAKDCEVTATFGTPLIIDDRWTDRQLFGMDAALFDESQQGHEADYVPTRSPATIQYVTTIVSHVALMGITLNKLYCTSRSTSQPITPADLEDIEPLIQKCSADCPNFIDMELQDTSSTPKAELVYRPLIRASHATILLFYHSALAKRHSDKNIQRDSWKRMHDSAREICEVMSYIREHTLYWFCPFWLITGVFHAMAVLLGDCRDALLRSEGTRNTDSLARLRELNEDLGILEQKWKLAGWIRELMRMSLAKLRENVRIRNAKQARMSELERGEQETAQATHIESQDNESPRAFFEQTKELFPEIENILSWGLTEEFLAAW